jgi:hypothetical protein
MESAFTYPSLAFGSESTPLGEQLQRYSMFNNKNYSAEKDDNKVPIAPETTNQPPNDGGDVYSPQPNVGDKIAIIPLALTILALGVIFWTVTEIDTTTIMKPLSV